ncbi:hypothetical protein WB401_03185 [Streptomyces brasiliscabiei]|uniref:Integral membrane protein n=1 Tax=Streptomyces brasiliscabiei TaxID=2736302 RepID=A0ABU8GFQ9_9ACTN
MSAESTPQEPDTVPRPRPRPRRRRTVGLVGVALLVVAGHLGAGGLLLASPGPWRHWAAGILLVVVATHAAGVVHRRTAHRRATTKPVDRRAVDET